MTAPESCTVVVYRNVNGRRESFAEPVFWMEAYARAGRGTEIPNDMWRKRPRGQLHKCAKAASLRAAFPEDLGSVYAAEEMEDRETAAAGPTIEATAEMRREPVSEESEFMVRAASRLSAALSNASTWLKTLLSLLGECAAHDDLSALVAMDGVQTARKTAPTLIRCRSRTLSAQPRRGLHRRFSSRPAPPPPKPTTWTWRTRTAWCSGSRKRRPSLRLRRCRRELTRHGARNTTCCRKPDRRGWTPRLPRSCRNSGAKHERDIRRVGHTRTHGSPQRPGYVKEVEIAGGKMLRIDIPVQKDDAGQDVTVTEFYGAAAIYCMTPCSEELARGRVTRYNDPRPVRPMKYRAQRRIEQEAKEDDDEDVAF